MLAGLILAGLALLAPSAGASPPTMGVPGMSESELRAAETEMLGPAHAAEHAELRALMRREANGELPAAQAADDPPAQIAAEGPPEDVGRWSAIYGIPFVGINAVMLPTGKVMFWDGGPAVRDANTSQAWLWDPANPGAPTRVDPPTDPNTGLPANLWCSGQSLLADGRVLTTGGNLEYAPDGGSFKGLNQVYTYNPFNGTWRRQPNMAHGRWYPGQAVQPDGRVVIIGGYDENAGGNNQDVDLFTPSADPNGVGTTQTIGTRPADGGLYPHMYVLPSGRTLVAGPNDSDTWFFTGLNPLSTSDVPDLPDPPSGNRQYGSGVIAPGGPGGSGIVTLIGGGVIAGGGGDATSTAINFNENSPSSWTSAPSLNIARTHQNTVLLPDGSMATVGGGIGDGGSLELWEANDNQRQIELRDPATGLWRLGPSQQQNRAYHSTALLLPDGRVMSAGDELHGSDPKDGDPTDDEIEIYEPPYLFHGARPSITSAPDSVAWGDNFGVYSPDAVSRAVLIAPAATTHANDMNQRHVELQVTGAPSGGLNVLAPPSSSVAPPGYYMLFLLNAQGVPSVARFVRLDPSAPDRPNVVKGVGASGKSKSIKVKGKNLILKIECDLPAGSSVSCQGEIVVTSGGAGSSAAAAKKGKQPVLASGSYSVPPGKTRKVKVKLTKRGRAMVSRRGKLKATVTLTNTLNDASDSFKVKL